MTLTSLRSKIKVLSKALEFAFAKSRSVEAQEANA